MMKTFYEFCAKLNDIVDSSFNLGEVRKFVNLPYMRKIMRPKVITIEKSKDIDFVKIETFVLIKKLKK
jgi:hypothetical protein